MIPFYKGLFELENPFGINVEFLLVIEHVQNVCGNAFRHAI